MATDTLHSTRIKFCGLRRAADVRQAALLGVDAIGFVLVPRSRRYLSPEQAARLRATLPPFVAAVALFQDAAAAQVQQAIDVLRPDLLQFHGAEDAAFCASFGLPYLKAVAMGARQSLPTAARRYRDAAGLLLDSHAPGEMGGSGKTFQWARFPALRVPVVLAGGLTPKNVGAAIRAVRPYAVDVSSGIETAPGIKDWAKMRDFVAAVRKADRVK
jgi:phosphoribosylanthranilate isomerase